ncbi:MAG: alkaline phosphatase [Bacteroidota bacterium]
MSYSHDAINEQDAADKTSAYIKQKKPLLTFVHLDHVDGAGHTYGWGTSQYYDAISRADDLIGQITDAVKEAGIYDETLFIITADHGWHWQGTWWRDDIRGRDTIHHRGKGSEEESRNENIIRPIRQRSHCSLCPQSRSVLPHGRAGQRRTVFEGFPDVVFE